MPQKRRVLVTGGAGFIGSSLVEALVNRGDLVTVLDDFSGGSLENLGRIESENLKVIRGDVRDFETLRTTTKHVDQIFHLAVLNLRLSLKEPFPVHEVNATGTINVCMAVKENPNIKKLIYVSSSEVYGTAKYVPMDEEHPLGPTTPYGASKAAGELYVQSFHTTFGIPSVIVRPFNAYGPRAREDAYAEVIPRFVERVVKGFPPEIHGDGKQTRDFTYVTDTVNGIILASECDDLLGDRVNIAYGKEVSINDVANIVLKIFKKEGEIEPIHTDPRPGDVRRHFASIAKATRTLEFKPKVPIDVGIERYVEWFRESSK
jgi:UDP-glucose 4-epimerase